MNLRRIARPKLITVRHFHLRWIEVLGCFGCEDCLLMGLLGMTSYTGSGKHIADEQLRDDGCMIVQFGIAGSWVSLVYDSHRGVSREKSLVFI